jgi:polyisoprenoid-binding protein YceI
MLSRFLMVRRLLEFVGLLALVGLATVAGVGLFVVSGRMRVVVQPDAAPAPDPVALLRDDLQAQHRDLEALTQQLGDSFQRLQTVFAAAAERRDPELVAALQRGREAQVDIAARLERLEVAVRALARAEPAAAQSSNTPSANTPPADPQPTALAPTAPVPAALVPAAADPPAPTGSPAAAPAKQPFLGFQLPSRRFRFDGEQDFAILPDLSRVGFDAKSTLHDFTGATSKVAGTFTANLADPAGGWRGAVTCTVASLITGVDGRDAAMRDNLDAAHHPEIRFEIIGFKPAERGIDAAAMTVRGEIRGTMTIRGVSKELRMPVAVSVDDSKRLFLEGHVPLRLDDYDVPVPNQLGFVKMDPEVNLWIALRARVRGGADGR